jgi:hypothetical protein
MHLIPSIPQLLRFDNFIRRKHPRPVLRQQRVFADWDNLR